jgi:uncharacterized protein (DUF2147 family)
MIPFLSRTAGLALVFTAAFTSAPASAADAIGTWLTQQGDARIRVAKCARAMCGTIVWLRDAVDPSTGQPPVDSRNPDPSKRNRKILGLRIFAMASDGNGGWSGNIYNSDDGQTYQGKLVVRSAQQLEVQGCAGPMCGSETWSKVGR